MRPARRPPYETTGQATRNRQKSSLEMADLTGRGAILFTSRAEGRLTRM